MQNTGTASVRCPKSDLVFTQSIICLGKNNTKLHNNQIWKGKNAELTDYGTRTSQVPNWNTGVKMVPFIPAPKVACFIQYLQMESREIKGFLFYITTICVSF